MLSIVQRLFGEIVRYKVCVNPIPYINIDDHNRISATDCRKIRRMCRDMKHRNISAEGTITMWDSIRRGEEQNIFPYLETADIILNTTLVYELAILKKHAMKTLSNIGQDSSCYVEAKRLMGLLSQVVSIEDESDIPASSIIQEFLR